MRRISFVTIATVVALLQRTAAQEPGERVRLTMGSAFSRRLVGTLIHQDPESVWVQLGGHAAPVAVARSAATRLEISRGHRRATINGAGIGAGLGAIGGFVFSGLAASESRPCGSPGLVGVCLTDWYGRAFRGGLIGGAVGALIGAALGYAVRTEVWAGVPLGQTHHLSLAPRGSGLALSLAF